MTTTTRTTTRPAIQIDNSKYGHTYLLKGYGIIATTKSHPRWKAQGVAIQLSFFPLELSSISITRMEAVKQLKLMRKAAKA